METDTPFLTLAIGGCVLPQTVDQARKDLWVVFAVRAVLAVSEVPEAHPVLDRSRGDNVLHFEVVIVQDRVIVLVAANDFRKVLASIRGVPLASRAGDDHLAVLEDQCSGLHRLFLPHDQRRELPRIVLSVAALESDGLQVEVGGTVVVLEPSRRDDIRDLALATCDFRHTLVVESRRHSKLVEMRHRYTQCGWLQEARVDRWRAKQRLARDQAGAEVDRQRHGRTQGLRRDEWSGAFLFI